MSVIVDVIVDGLLVDVIVDVISVDIVPLNTVDCLPHTHMHAHTYIHNHTEPVRTHKYNAYAAYQVVRAARASMHAVCAA